MEQVIFENNVRLLRRTYSYIGICYTVLLIASTVAGVAMPWIPYWIGESAAAIVNAPWWSWTCMALPLYAVAMPLCYVMMRRLPAQAPQKQRLSAKQLLALIPICICVMYVGNIIGTLLSLLLSGGTAQNEVAELAMDTHPLKVVVMVILAPIFEDWICRKVLLDRVKQYGEFLSAVMSGVIFGLLHQHFFQFFYAFALGFVFSWMYLHSGRLIIPIIFHMGINFIGSVVAPMINNLIDYEALDAVNTETVTPDALAALFPEYGIVLGYSLLMIIITVIGFVMIVRRHDRLRWHSTAWDMPIVTAVRYAFVNGGMITYTVLCGVMFVLSLTL